MLQPRRYGRFPAGERTAKDPYILSLGGLHVKVFPVSKSCRRSDDCFRRQSTGARQGRPDVVAQNCRRRQGLCATVPACDRGLVHDADGAVFGNGFDKTDRFEVDSTLHARPYRSVRPPPFRQGQSYGSIYVPESDILHTSTTDILRRGTTMQHAKNRTVGNRVPKVEATHRRPGSPPPSPLSRFSHLPTCLRKKGRAPSNGQWIDRIFFRYADRRLLPRNRTLLRVDVESAASGHRRVRHPIRAMRRIDNRETPHTGSAELQEHGEAVGRSTMHDASFLSAENPNVPIKTRTAAPFG